MSLSKHKISLLREYVNFICESCGLEETEVGFLEPHRIRPGEEGGEYKLTNIKMCCSNCHEEFTSAQRMAKL